MPRLLPLALLSLLVGCAAEAEPTTFIALGPDFADYREWIAFDRGLDPVPPAHEVESVIYLDALPPAGATAVPIGTRIVKVEMHGEDPTTWELHAMVKRGGDFNADGSVGWEFFELSHIDDGPPLIVWRGEGPADGNGYVPAPGSEDVIGCNHCHASWPENDSVLSPDLDLRILSSE